MKKNEYISPAMETVELPGITLLLDLSGNYGQGDDDDTPGDGFDGGAE